MANVNDQQNLIAQQLAGQQGQMLSTGGNPGQYQPGLQPMVGTPQQMQQFQGQMQQQQPGQPGQPVMMQEPPKIIHQEQEKPIDLLIKSGLAQEVKEEKEKEVSLKTLKPAEIDKIMEVFKKDRAVANSYYQDTIEPKLKEREEEYYAREKYYSKVFPHLSESSQYCDRSLKTTVDTLIPSYKEVFVGMDDPVSVKGVNVDDDDKADKIQQLLKYQLQRKNSYSPFMEYNLRDALILNYSVAKVYWKRTEKHQQYQMMLSANDMDTITLLYQEFQKGTIDIIATEQLPDAPDLIALTFDKVTLTDNYPVIDYMPPSELRFTPEGKTLDECKFKAHRKMVSGDYLKRKEQEGIYQDIDKALENMSAGDTSPNEYDLNKNEELQTIQGRIKDDDNASKQAELWEAYMQVDYNNDGVYEDVIVHAVGDTPIRISKNEMGAAPFFINESERSPHTVFNDTDGLCDNLIQQQNLKTAIFRQCIINVAKNNSPRQYINMDNVDMDAVIDNEEFIPVEPGPNGSVSDSIFIPPQLPFSQFAMSIVEMAQNEVESQSGSTRYNQGLDSNSLNKTATGLTAIMGASEKRMRNTARMMVETFLVPMMKYIIKLNQKYLSSEELVRLTNSNVTIKKEDLDIDYDLIINVGEGAGTKEAQIQYLMLIMNQIFPTLEQRGLVKPESWYALTKSLFEKAGIRYVTNEIVDPASDEGKAMAAQSQQAQQAQLQTQLALLKAKEDLELKKAAIPRMSVAYKDLPIDAQMQALKANGLKTTAPMLQTKDVINHA